MQTLLKAVRDTLVGDATLIDLVGSESDIRSSYAATLADYPVVSLSVASGGSGIQVSGVTNAALRIEVRSDVNKVDAHGIYARIKTLIHNQEQAVSDSSCKIHLILETDLDDAMYDGGADVWVLRASYAVVFSESGILVTTAADGAIYAHETNVTVDSDKLIATFRGEISLNVLFQQKNRSEGERFPKRVYHNEGIAIVTIEEVTFKPETYELLWSVAVDESDTLADGSTASTSYTVQQSTAPTYLQFLFRCTQTGDGNALEIEADRAICSEIRVPFSKKDLSIHDCNFLCLGDSNDSVVKVSVEN